MGHVLDLVPNHMGIAKSANPWWLDVLENGPSSRFARFFDIEWHPVKDELADKVLIPILGDQYGAVLERQELHAELSRRRVRRSIPRRRSLPIAPDTYGRIFDDADRMAGRPRHQGDDADELLSIVTIARDICRRASVAIRDAIATRAREKEVVKRRLRSARRAQALTSPRSSTRASRHVQRDRRRNRAVSIASTRLLNAQSYRLAHWRVASEEINYRRFFDVNQLAALRMEDPSVFDEVHRFVFELVARGAVPVCASITWTACSRPRDYLGACRRCSPASDATHSFFIVVEKILGGRRAAAGRLAGARHDRLRVRGDGQRTVRDRRNERAFDDIYRRFVAGAACRSPISPIAASKQVLHETMSGDINSLGHRLNRFSERNRHYRDFTLYSLISTLKEVIACFPVYRTYVTPTIPSATTIGATSSRPTRNREASRAGESRPSCSISSAELLLKADADIARTKRDERERFIGKFQQITSPVSAKAIEDTALYIYNRLISLNEVGSIRLASVSTRLVVHEWMRERQEQWPSALSATSTHDSKRGEDVRARLNVLSEIPAAWKAAIKKWRGVNRRFKTEVKGLPAPDANDEYLLYQTLVGAWPFETDAGDSTGVYRANRRLHDEGTA